jgi:hypothetical protein
VSHSRGGSVEPATAQRHACDSPRLGAVIDKHGKVLALGRTRRLVSKAQCRALLIGDQMCRYPGCHQTRHLKVHYAVPWILGGALIWIFDLAMPVGITLRCMRAVSPSPLMLTAAGYSTNRMGGCVIPGLFDDNLARHLASALRRDAAQQDQLTEVDSFQHPKARTIRPRWAGEPFDLHACMQALHHQTPRAEVGS